MPVNGNLKITNGTNNDVYTLFDACNGTEIDCFNLYLGTFYNLVSGTSYILRVSNRNSQTRTGTFKVQAFQTPPNNICSSAENISITTTSTTTFNLDTNACTNSGASSTCENTSYTHIDQWYSFTMPVNGNLKITNGSGNDFYTLFDTCSGTEIDCFNFYKGTFYNLVSGSSYILRVSNRDYQTRTGTFKVQAFQTPPNNICSSAENISITTTSTTTVNLDTNACTNSGASSTCENTSHTYIDQWYSFTMPVDGNLKITDGSSNDFYTLFDTCNGTEIDCFNFYKGTFYNLTAGSSYILRVSNRDINARTGAFKVQAFQTPSNDICSSAENISITTTSTTTINIDTNACTDNGASSTCENTSHTYIDQWYSFTMPVDGNLKITDGSGNDFYTLFDTCSGTEINCFNFYFGTFYNLVSGTSYILRVSNRDINTRTGAFKVQVFETATNDHCTDALNLSVGIYDEFLETKTLFGATASASAVPNNTCGILGSGEDVWFTVQVPSSGKLSIETSQANGSTLNDTVLQVFSGSCGSFTEIACDDNSGNGNFAKISLTGQTPNQTLYIRLFENGSDIADYYNIFAYDNNCASKTVWNGSTWSNGIPTASSIVEFNGNYLADTAGLDMCICKINSGNTVTVQGGKYLNLTDDLINNGNIILENQASFVQSNANATITGTGSYSTKINTNPLTDARYTYFSSPVQNAYINVFNPWAQTNRTFSFDGANQIWTTANTSDLMISGKGYIVRPPNPVTFNYPTTGTPTSFVGETIFHGKYNTGDITHNITYNAGGTDDDNELVGNPYPSAITTATLFTDNPRANAFYFWTHEHAENTGVWVDDYAIYNSTGYTSGNAAAPAPTYIASGQGFFVVGNSGAPNPQLTFKNSQRVKDQNNQFLRPVDEQLDKIWLNLSINNTGINSQILIGFNPICTDGIDAQYDATRFDSGSAISFYSKGVGVDTEKLAIQTRGILTNDDTIIPLGFNHNDANYNSFIIEIDHLENLTNTDVFLHDLELNITHNLKNGAYFFTNNTVGDINQRFELIFSRNALGIEDNLINNESLIVSQNNSILNVKTQKGSLITGIQLYDILGKQLYNSTNNQPINLNNIAIGNVIFIKVKLENGKTLNTKFIKM